MSNWITLITSDLRDREVAAMVQALQSAALGEDQQDPLPELMSGAVFRVRAAVASAPGNVLDPQPGSIPHSMKELTIRLILRTAKGRLNIALDPDEVRDAQWDERTLREIALGNLRVEQPGPTDVPGGGFTSGSGVQAIPSCAARGGLPGLDDL